MENTRATKLKQYGRQYILPILIILLALAMTSTLSVLADEETAPPPQEGIPEEHTADLAQEPEVTPMVPELTEAMYEEAVIAETEEVEEAGEPEIPLADLPHTGLGD